jgi:hypothetical protein
MYVLDQHWVVKHANAASHPKPKTMYKYQQAPSHLAHFLSQDEVFVLQDTSTIASLFWSGGF